MRKFTTAQIDAAFDSVGLLDTVKRRANVYNLVRAGNVNGAFGTLMAGADINLIRQKRREFNIAISEAQRVAKARGE